jgi:hypothetical protein
MWAEVQIGLDFKLEQKGRLRAFLLILVTSNFADFWFLFAAFD